MTGPGRPIADRLMDTMTTIWGTRVGRVGRCRKTRFHNRCVTKRVVGEFGEVDGLQVSLAAARNKLAQLDELATRSAAIPLGMPTTGPTR